MTSAHSMQPPRLRRSTRTIALLLLALTGCATEEPLHPPSTLYSPYDRPQLWAVAPFANESGVSIVKVDRVADLFVEQAEAIYGVDTIPVNRILAAMRKTGMRSINSPADALTLMNLLDVDGLIVGTVTAYDPYQPPKFGAAIQLFQRESKQTAIGVDPIALTRAPNDVVALGDMPTPAAPIAQASAVFDAGNHQTLAWLDEYAIGRAEPKSAYGKRIFLVDMELYTQFAAYRLLHDLLEHEQVRQASMTAQPVAR